MIVIRSTKLTPRLEYVLSFIFDVFLENPYKWISPETPRETGDFIIDYGSNNTDFDLQIYSEGFCFETGIRSALPELSSIGELPALFTAPPSADFPCDLFSMAFFCLSRYEEYQIEERDEHNRFCSHSTVFNSYLHLPYLDRHLLHFENLLYERGAITQKKSRSLKWWNTIDVDIAFAFKGRSRWRRMGAAFKDVVTGDKVRQKYRRSVLRGASPDPFDTYGFIREEAAKAEKTIFFFLCGTRSKYDINLDPSHPEVRKTIRMAMEFADIGIHPSYASFRDPHRIAAEKQKLEDASGTNIRYSRRHFLRMELPGLFHDLLSSGITTDFSMGFHDAIGFRSGTAYPHRAYDLPSEKMTELQLVPLAAMDSALKNYMRLDTAAALQTLKSLFENAKATGGVFVTVWHNHSLADQWEWENWRKVYEGFANFAALKS